jgi:hypothetical protein
MFLFGAVLLASCSKEDKEIDKQIKIKRIISNDYTGNGPSNYNDTLDLFYDQQGRLVRQIDDGIESSFFGRVVEEMLFSYLGNDDKPVEIIYKQLIYRRIDIDSVVIKATYTYDNQNRLLQQVQTTKSNGAQNNKANKYTFNYLTNGDAMRYSFSGYYNSSTDTYSFTLDNVDSLVFDFQRRISATYKIGQGSFRFANTIVKYDERLLINEFPYKKYIYSLPGEYGDHHGNFSFGYNPIRITYTYDAFPNNEYEERYTYKYDAVGLKTEQHIGFYHGGTINSGALTYYTYETF